MTAPPNPLAAALGDRYRIERELGQGGMATVYLAEDVRHHRKVAIKVLHPELAAVIGPERFLKEIELTASLQHPHILPLFDSGHAAAILYYVMPYVEGETLRRRLERERQLPVADAVRIATDVADALEYAHRHGVVHRDIKPENILLHDGRPVVADFGIALAVQQAGGTRMTQTGMSLGTPQYMAPEQAMGDRAVDHRADIYALGAVTYEMLAGEPPFSGPNSQAVVARVLTEDPKPLALQRRSIPERVEAAVFTALEKLPADRFSTAAAFAQALTGSGAAAYPIRRARSRRQQVPLLAAGAIGALALAAGSYWVGTRSAGSSPTAAFGTATPVTWDAGLEVHPAISPDGRMVAYAAGVSATRLRIFVRPVGSGRAVPLTDDSTQLQSEPHWSPDGTRILFLARGGAFSAPSLGGPARQEVPVHPGTGITTASWSPDTKRIAYVAGSDSLFVREEDGRSRLLLAAHELSFCSWSPDATRIACSSGNIQYTMAIQQFGNLSPSRLLVVRVADGAVSELTDRSAANQSPIWQNDRRILFVSNRHGPRDIYGVKVDGDGRPAGPVERLTTGLGAHSISLSADGTRLAYSAYATTGNIWSLPIPSGGPVSAYGATQVTHGNQLVETLSISGDGRWLLYDSNLSGNADLYRVPASGGQPERLNTDPSDDFSPNLSPDGREVAFHSWRTGNRDLFVLPLDGGPLQRVTDTPRQEVIASWSPDGRTLAAFEFEAAYDTSGRGSVWIIRRDASGAWGAPVQRIRRGNWAAWSPSGRELAYAVGSQSRTVFVAPADSGPARLVYNAGDNDPRAEQLVWSADGRSIYFKSHDAAGRASIWSVPTAGGAARQLVRFDDPARPSARFNIAAGPRHFYFTIEERQSDVWVMEVERR